MSERIYFASSVLADPNYGDERFDCIRTTEIAKEHRVDGVQWFLDKRFHNDTYLDKAVKELRESGLGLVIHLPNKLEPEDALLRRK